MKYSKTDVMRLYHIQDHLSRQNARDAYSAQNRTEDAYTGTTRNHFNEESNRYIQVADIRAHRWEVKVDDRPEDISNTHIIT